MPDSNVLDLIGRCGFYCGSCPDYAQGDCPGCLAAHEKGDCYTLDCSLLRGKNHGIMDG